MNSYLFIGGGGQTGQASIRAVRSFDKHAVIIATTSGKENIAGADKSIFGVNVKDEFFLEKILEDSLLASMPCKAIFYSPATGPTGFPTRLAKESEVRFALDYCAIPLVKLYKALSPALAIGFSAFVNLEYMLSSYGAITYAKIALDELAIKNPQNFKMVRAGAFQSKTSRGLGLLLRKNLRGAEEPESVLLRQKLSGHDSNFSKRIYQYAWENESTYYAKKFDRSFRPTESSDIERVIGRFLRGEPAPIINVIGDWEWIEPNISEAEALLNPDLLKIARQYLAQSCEF